MYSVSTCTASSNDNSSYVLPSTPNMNHEQTINKNLLNNFLADTLKKHFPGITAPMVSPTSTSTSKPTLTSALTSALTSTLTLPQTYGNNKKYEYYDMLSIRK